MFQNTIRQEEAVLEQVRPHTMQDLIILVLQEKITLTERLFTQIHLEEQPPV